MSFVLWDEFEIVSDFPEKHLRDSYPVFAARRREKGFQLRPIKFEKIENFSRETFMSKLTGP